MSMQSSAIHTPTTQATDDSGSVATNVVAVESKRAHALEAVDQVHTRSIPVARHAGALVDLCFTAHTGEARRTHALVGGWERHARAAVGAGRRAVVWCGAERGGEGREE